MKLTHSTKNVNVPFPEIIRTCNICEGRGWDQDEHPHNGSPIGERYTCTTCKGTGRVKDYATDKERLHRIEKMLNLGDFE